MAPPAKRTRGQAGEVVARDERESTSPRRTRSSRGRASAAGNDPVAASVTAVAITPETSDSTGNRRITRASRARAGAGESSSSTTSARTRPFTPRLQSTAETQTNDSAAASAQRAGSSSNSRSRRTRSASRELVHGSLSAPNISSNAPLSNDAHDYSVTFSNPPRTRSTRAREAQQFQADDRRQSDDEVVNVEATDQPRTELVSFRASRVLDAPRRNASLGDARSDATGGATDDSGSRSPRLVGRAITADDLAPFMLPPRIELPGDGDGQGNRDGRTLVFTGNSNTGRLSLVRTLDALAEVVATRGGEGGVSSVRVDLHIDLRPQPAVDPVDLITSNQLTVPEVRRVADRVLRDGETALAARDRARDAAREEAEMLAVLGDDQPPPAPANPLAGSINLLRTAIGELQEASAALTERRLTRSQRLREEANAAALAAAFRPPGYRPPGREETEERFRQMRLRRVEARMNDEATEEFITAIQTSIQAAMREITRERAAAAAEEGNAEETTASSSTARERPSTAAVLDMLHTSTAALTSSAPSSSTSSSTSMPRPADQSSATVGDWVFDEETAAMVRRLREYNRYCEGAPRNALDATGDSIQMDPRIQGIICATGAAELRSMPPYDRPNFPTLDHVLRAWLRDVHEYSNGTHEGIGGLRRRLEPPPQRVISVHMRPRSGAVTGAIFMGIQDMMNEAGGRGEVNEAEQQLRAQEDEEEAKESTLKSAEWGECRICMADEPSNPVGCKFCRQLVGCTKCCNRWHRANKRPSGNVMDLLFASMRSNGDRMERERAEMDAAIARGEGGEGEAPRDPRISSLLNRVIEQYGERSQPPAANAAAASGDAAPQRPQQPQPPRMNMSDAWESNCPLCRKKWRTTAQVVPMQRCRPLGTELDEADRAVPVESDDEFGL